MALLDDIANHFVADGVATEVGTDLFKAFLPEGAPESGNVAIAIYETGGQGPRLGLGADAIQHEFPNIQVVTRGANPQDYSTPRAKSESLYQSLAKVQGQTLGTTVYLMIVPLQPPFSLGPDEKQRHRIVFNARATKEPS